MRSVCRLKRSPIHGVEYYGRIGFLKAGLYFADRITTVSPTYAREILSDEGGMGLGGLLRERSCDLSGILNGIDTSVWDPATDPHIPGCFYADMPNCLESDVLESRAINKAALQRRLGLQPAPDAFLLGVIGRLSRQKGLDLLLENLPTIEAKECSWPCWETEEIVTCNIVIVRPHKPIRKG